MLPSILRTYSYSPDILYTPLVSLCLLSSFEDFTKHLLLKLICGGGQLTRRQIIHQLLGGGYPGGRSIHEQRSPVLDRSLQNSLSSLKDLNIISSEQSKQDNLYRVHRKFIESLNMALSGKDLIRHFRKLNQAQMASLNLAFNSALFTPDPFELLQLLESSPEVLDRYELTSLNGQGTISRNTLKYICAQIGQKICFLLRGLLKGATPSTLDSVLQLAQLEPRAPYSSTTNDVRPVLDKLSRIKLVTRIGGDSFVTSDFLHRFYHPLETMLDQPTATMARFDCSIIIESNFHVYVQIHNPKHKKLLLALLERLISIHFQGYDIQDLILGSITCEKMQQVFEQNISSSEFFSFFAAYVNESSAVQRDLGKWNKIKFLGLEGPQQSQKIPKNVRQQVELWQSLGVDYAQGFESSGED